MAASPPAQIASQADPLAGMLLRASLGLVVVLVLILALAWVVRRWGGSWRQAGQVPLHVVGSLALGPRERIVVVAVQDTWLVVGIGTGGMRTLHTLPAGDLPATPRATPAGEATAPFTQRLQQALHRRSP